MNRKLKILAVAKPAVGTMVSTRVRRMRGTLVISRGALLRVMLLCALAGGPLAICGGLFFISQEREARIATEVRDLVEAPAGRQAQILAFFTDLDRLTGPPCQDADLRQLRALLISSDIVRDVARREHGRLACSALYGATQASVPALATPGYVLSSEQTVWRNVTLPFAPGRTYLIIGHRDFILVIRPYHAVQSLHDDTLTLSRFFINRSTGLVSNYDGQPVGLTAALLHNGAEFWRRGRLFSIACVPDEAICLAMSTNWVGLLHGNVQPLLMFALVGAVTGSATGVLFMLWRHERISLYGRLRRALRDEELTLAYQPIVAAASGQIVGAEALMRWQGKGGAQIGPDQFIPEAEKGGLIGDLTCLAISLVGRELGAMLRENRFFVVSINIVADDLADPRFHAALAQHIQAAGIAPDQIALELTERRAAQVEAADMVLAELRALGYKIYIDDFGTGYSSLTYLSDLSIDAIKLDKSFTMTVDTGAARARLVGPIMDMARDIGVRVIVEGVETEAQAAYFRAYGAMSMQGWRFGRPEPAAALIERVARGNGAGVPMRKDVVFIGQQS
jgi:sensor c-di-GMP phosphodiesterase-like protein